MAKVLILEDEEYTRKFLKKIVTDISIIIEVFDTGSAAEAINLIREHNIEIALLDIELQEDELNGIETAKIINALCPEVNFVFVTAFSNYAIESFAVRPYDYVLKPVKKEKLIEVISKIIIDLNKKANNSVKLVIKNQSETIFLSLEDIFFIEKIKKYILIHTNEQVYQASQNLNEVEMKLDNNFLRVHKSYIINQDKVRRIIDCGNRSFEIEFLGYNKKALMSRYRFEDLKSKFTPSF